MNSKKQKIAIAVSTAIFVFLMISSAPVHATVIFNSGWENSGGTDVTDAGAWSGAVGSPIVTSSTAFQGYYSEQCDMNSTNYCYVNFGSSPLLHVFVKFYFKTTGYPSDYQGRAVMIILDDSYSLRCGLEYYNKGNGVCEWLLWTGTDYGPDSGYVQQLNLSQWYYIEVEYYANGNNSQFHAWVDGTLVQTTNDSVTAPAQSIGVGCCAITAGIGNWSATGYFDSVVVSTSFNDPEPSPSPSLSPSPSPSPSLSPSPSPSPSLSPSPSPSPSLSPSPSPSEQPTPSPEPQPRSSLPMEFIYAIVATAIIIVIVVKMLVLKKCHISHS
jgi:hypothetical protein